MKIKSMFTTFILKALLIISFITIGFASFTKCDAQSIVGKWKAISIKTTYDKQVSETQMATSGSLVIDFKSGHTYVLKSTSINNPKVTQYTGTWVVTGDQLEMKLDPKQEDPKNNPTKDNTGSKNSTMSIKGNTMVLSTIVHNIKVTNKQEVIYTKM